MIRPFVLSDLDSILQIESQSFPKSPYDWATFLRLHHLYPETFLVCHNPTTSRLEVSGSASARANRLGLSRALRQAPGDEHGRMTSGSEEKILGYIIFSEGGHIISIAVHPQHRKNGIGARLLRRALKTLHSKIVWAEVRRSNQGAQAFYLKMGFQITGMVPNYYGNEDALIVHRVLSPSIPTDPVAPRSG